MKNWIGYSIHCYVYVKARVFKNVQNETKPCMKYTYHLFVPLSPLGEEDRWIWLNFEWKTYSKDGELILALDLIP